MKQEMININANLVAEPTFSSFENEGEKVEVANVKKYWKGKEYINCAAYGEKSDIPKDFKQGDFVKIFVQIRTSIDDNGREHSNIRIFSSKLLKTKEQMRGQEEKKDSVLGVINKYQAEDKQKLKKSKEKLKKKKDNHDQCGLRIEPTFFSMNKR